jgi:hypothetical protein
MNRSLDLAGRLQEVLLDGKWIANTNFKEQILSLNWEQATMKVANLNTIALLTFHINYYLKGVLQVLNGGTLDIHDKYSFDMPVISNQADWDTLVHEFLNNATAFVNKVKNLNDEILDSSFVDEKYGTYQRNLEAIIEHTYYHLGQISLIRKMILSK